MTHDVKRTTPKFTIREHTKNLIVAHRGCVHFHVNFCDDLENYIE